MIPAAEVAAFFELLMQAVVDWDLVFAGEGHEGFHMGDGIDGLESIGHQRVEFTFGVEEFIVRVYENYSEVWGWRGHDWM